MYLDFKFWVSDPNGQHSGLKDYKIKLHLISTKIEYSIWRFFDVQKLIGFYIFFLLKVIKMVHTEFQMVQNWILGVFSIY